MPSLTSPFKSWWMPLPSFGLSSICRLFYATCKGNPTSTSARKRLLNPNPLHDPSHEREPMKKFLIVIAILASIAACRSSQMAQWGALGADQKVILYAADGHVIREWTSDGKVSTESGSDGWFFRDRATGKLVRVSGTVVIEPA